MEASLPPSSSPSLPGSAIRKERGAIAAQACDTCRSRKQKCDEQRPKCSTCIKFKLDCNYREPLPTKKDKTLVEILDRLKVLEGKIDSLSFCVNGAVLAQGQVLSSMSGYGGAVQAPPFSSVADTPMSSSSEGDSDYRYASSVQQMLAWPAMQPLMPKMHALDAGGLERDGPALDLAQQAGSPALPAQVGRSPLYAHQLHVHADGLVMQMDAKPSSIAHAMEWDGHHARI